MRWLWIFLTCGSLSAATLRYVDPNATGANNGTSWANAWTSLNSASGVSAGTIVYISGGSVSQTYTPGSWSMAKGSSGNYVTYQTGQDAGHNGMVIFDCGVTDTPQWFNDSSPWYVNLTGQVGTLTNLTLTNYTGWKIFAGTSGYFHLSYINFPTTKGQLNFYNSDHIEVDHCYINKVYGNNDQSGIVAGPQINGTTPTYGVNSFHHNFCTIPCNTSQPGFGDDGISWIDCTDVYSNIFQVVLDPSYPTTGTAQHADMIQADGSFNRVFCNTYQGVGESIYFLDALSPEFIHDIQFYNNVVYMTHSVNGTVARGLDWRPEQTGGTLSNLFVLNNTFVDECGLSCIMLNSSGDIFKSCVVANNLFYNCNPDDAPSASGLTFFYNKAIAGNHGSTLGHSQTVAPGGSTTVSFVSYTENSANNNLHLQATDTAALGWGTNYPNTIYTYDHDGVTRPAVAWALGAYELGSGSSVTPPVITYLGNGTTMKLGGGVTMKVGP